ncbi:MAG: hypothetical protein ACK2UE_06595 [Anaerolineales bacterium]|jgi:hypothetical protein
MKDLDLFNATKYAFNNRDELIQSDICGCYYCINMFPSSEIVEWVWERKSNLESDQTGICPYCGIDSIIGSESGIPICVDILYTLNRLFFNNQPDFLLFRPVGPIELKLIEESGWQRFPPRLPEQPIFYPVLNLEYARQIAKNWNVKQSGSGYITEFLIDRNYAKRFKVKIVGSMIHQELWIPAEDLDEFNNNIIGKINLIESYSDSDNQI